MRAPFLILGGASLLLAATTTAAAAASSDNEPLPMLRRRSGPRALRVLDDEDHWMDVPRTAPSTLGDDAGRPAWVYYPQAYEQGDDDTLWPLVLMIHGGGSDSYYHDRLLGVSARVDSHGYVALLPNGTCAVICGSEGRRTRVALNMGVIVHSLLSPTHHSRQARSTPTACASGTASAAVSAS
jgi:hypothetical protein